MNLYNLDSQTVRLIHSQNFLENSSVTDFIEEISKQHDVSLNDNCNLDSLDPKPFIRTFESVLQELKHVRDENQAKMDFMRSDVSTLELKHSKKVIMLSSEVSQIGTSINSLSRVVDKVGNTMSPLGEKLQEATSLKEKNLEIIFLCKCYNDFFKYNHSKLLIDLQNSRKPSDKKNCGKYISKLLKLAGKLSTVKSEEENEDKLNKIQQVYTEILKFSKNFEQNLIDEFQSSYENNDLSKMKECFDILIDFNENSVQTYEAYIDQIPSLNEQFPEETFLENEFLNEEPNEQQKFWNIISTPTSHYSYDNLIECIPELPELFEKLKHMFFEKFNSIKIVFNKSRNIFLKVLDMFLSKIFVHKLRDILFKKILNFSLSFNNLSYVRLLQLLYTITSEFVQDIKQFFVESHSKIYLEDSLISKKSTDNILDENTGAVEDLPKSLLEDLNSLIDSQFNLLFYEYLTKRNFIEKEKKSLDEIYANINVNLERKYPKIIEERALALKLQSTESVKESRKFSSTLSPYLVGSPTLGRLNSSNIASGILENTKILQLGTYMKSKLERSSSSASKMSNLNESLLSPKLDQIKNIFSDFNEDGSQGTNITGGKDENVSGDDDYENNDDIKFSKIDFMIQNSVESLSRISDLRPLDIAEYSLEILRILIFGVGTYLEYGMELAYFKMIHIEYKKADNINLDYLRIVGKANKVLKLLTDFIKMIIVPLSVNSAPIKKSIVSLVNGYLATCELSLNIILKGTVEIILSKVQLYLDKQKKKDYGMVAKKHLLGDLSSSNSLVGGGHGNSSGHERENSESFMDEFSKENTETCQEITRFLNGVYFSQLTSKKLLNSNNLDNFLVEIGVNFMIMFLTHLKKFQISDIGGIILTKDVIAYLNMIQEWKIDELTNTFSSLKELTSLYTVQPNYIDSIIKEGQLSKLSPSTVQLFVGRRSDYNSSFLNKFWQ